MTNRIKLNVIAVTLLLTLLGTGYTQEDKTTLARQCLGKDAKACDKLSKLVAKECDAMAPENFGKLNCQNSSQCWNNVGTMAKKLVETRTRYGKNSVQYVAEEERFAAILLQSDSCALFKYK